MVKHRLKRARNIIARKTKAALLLAISATSTACLNCSGPFSSEKNPKQHLLSRASLGAVTTIITTSSAPDKLSLWGSWLSFAVLSLDPWGGRQMLLVPVESQELSSHPGSSVFQGLGARRGWGWKAGGPRAKDVRVGMLHGAQWGAKPPPA